jgi:hypothetical protein
MQPLPAAAQQSNTMLYAGIAAVVVVILLVLLYLWNSSSSAPVLPCDRKDTTTCIFPTYTKSGNECRSANGNPAYSISGLANYSDAEFNGWLKGLHDRDNGNDKTKSEKAVVLDYVNRCLVSVPGVNA